MSAILDAVADHAAIGRANEREEIRKAEHAAPSHSLHVDINEAKAILSAPTSTRIERRLAQTVVDQAQVISNLRYALEES